MAGKKASKKTEIRKLKDYIRLYNMGFAAIGKLQRLAKESPDLAQQKAARKKSDQILKYMNKLRDAQRVHLTSPTDSETPAKRLKKAVKKAETRLKDLEDASKAIAAADKLLKLAKALLVIVA
ncbi:hypothetical protein PH5382_02355 [Phaeobacter sp. CECT 5382]|uniref:hypothetical protein n=1 Tax=Rhodobacterales TaxID=204455 RepID=UPI0006DA20FA|nr:hypothetical protein [Phaeobacter sp. CECT 5382]CUH88419.1 hypothetical protein PH5382_02355 [Phaeobacter sp. CECT 5382]